MVYMWFPGFQENSQNIDISKVEVPWNDQYEPIGPFSIAAVRDKIAIRSPNYITDLTKSNDIIVHFSMCSTLRTTIKSDRYNMDLRQCTFHFENMTKERRKALEHFILCSEGHYVGYKDPAGNYHVLLIFASEVTFTSDKRFAGDGPETNYVKAEDEASSMDLPVLFVKSYGSLQEEGD
jgi:hypothetical protein